MALSPQELTDIAYGISDRFEKVNSYYLELMAKQIREIGELDADNMHRLQQMAKMGNNIEAINDAIKTLNFSSSATYVPFIDGIGTACVYLIPYQYEEDYIKNAKAEAKQVLENVISPSTIVEYSVPEPIAVKLVAYIDIAEGTDIKYIKCIKIIVKKLWGLVVSWGVFCLVLFWLYPRHAEVPGPEIEPMPQQQPKPQE